MICSKCQGEVQPDWKACPRCGEHRAPQATCRKCGKELDSSWKACPFCGIGQSDAHTDIRDSVVKELHQTTETNQHVAGGATVAGSININVPAPATPSTKPEVEYENQVLLFLKAEGDLEHARTDLDKTRARLNIPLHVAEPIERACLERAMSGAVAGGLRERWDCLRPVLRKWSDESELSLPDEPDTVSVLRALANKGDDEAQCFLAQCYLRAAGNVVKDHTEAVKWLRLSADQGYPKAEYLLGWRYELGEGVAKDVAEAAKWFRKASQRGDSNATLHLALLLHEQERYTDAMPLFEKAANDDVIHAFVMLGVYHGNGLGCNKNDDKAVDLFKLAASRGSATAMYFVAQRHESGVGATKSLKEARTWYERAGAGGDEDAKEWLSKNAGFMGFVRRVLNE